MSEGMEFQCRRLRHVCAHCHIRFEARRRGTGLHTPGGTKNHHCNVCELLMAAEVSLNVRNLHTRTRR